MGTRRSESPFLGSIGVADHQNMTLVDPVAMTGLVPHLPASLSDIDRSPNRTRLILDTFFKGHVPQRFLLTVDRNWIELYNNGQYHDSFSCSQQFLKEPSLTDDDGATRASAVEYSVRSLEKMGRLAESALLLSDHRDLIDRFTILALLEIESELNLAHRQSVLQRLLFASHNRSLADKDLIKFALIETYLSSGNVSPALSLLNDMGSIGIVKRAHFLLRAGHVQNAVRLLDSIDDDDGERRVQLAVCFIRQNKFTAAIDVLRGVLALQPSHIGAALNLACALVYLQQPLESINILEGVIRADPNVVLRDPHLLQTLNSLYEMMNDNPALQQEQLLCLSDTFCPDVPLRLA